MAAANVVSETPSDELLVEQLRLGDEAAFNTLYQRYFDRVSRFVQRRMDNRADAEEIVQEVFINLFKSVHNFRGEAPFGAWVFGITRRTLANRFKKPRLATFSISDTESDSMRQREGGVSTEPSPLEAYEYRERAKRLEAAAESDLSPEQRRLFELHHLQDLSIGEIATQLSKSKDAVKSNLYRARRILLAR